MIYNQNPDKQVWKWHAVENGTRKLVEITGKKEICYKIKGRGQQRQNGQ